MAVYQFFNFLCWQIILINLAFVSAGLFIEDFSEGSTGIFKPCTGRSSFEVKNYSQYEDLELLCGSNDFFLSPGSEVSTEYCMESEEFEVEAGTVLSLTLYTSHAGEPYFIFRWAAVDAITGLNILSTSVFIDDSKVWRTSAMNITKAQAGIKVFFTITHMLIFLRKCIF